MIIIPSGETYMNLVFRVLAGYVMMFLGYSLIKRSKIIDRKMYSEKYDYRKRTKSITENK
jgi:hypothetical protein